jgi:hypothetical protein
MFKTRSFSLILTSSALAFAALSPLACSNASTGEGEGEGEAGGEGESEGEGDGGNEGEGEGEGAVVINEISCRGGDWIELVATQNASLAGLFLTDDALDATRRQPLTGTVAAGDFVVVDATAFGIACDDSVFIVNEAGSVQVRVDLPGVPDGSTWGRLPDVTGSFALNAATRGAANQAQATALDLRINEVDCRGNERIEIINAGGAAANMGGYRLVLNGDVATAFTLPPLPLASQGLGVILEDDPLNNIIGFGFNIPCNGALLSLQNPAGATVDAVVTTAAAEALSQCRLPDGTGALVACEETFDATNRAPIELGAGLFTRTNVTSLGLALSQADLQQLFDVPGASVAVNATVDDDAAVAATMTVLSGARTAPITGKPTFVLRFEDTARFRGLETIVLDGGVVDPSRLRDIAAQALYESQGLLAPQVGFTTLTVRGTSFGLYTIQAPIDGRRLRRTFEQTQHAYLVDGDAVDIGDVNGFEILAGNADRADLQAVADALTPFANNAAGYFAAAGQVLRQDDVLRFLAVEGLLAGNHGYGAGQDAYLIHIDGDGQARLLPTQAGGALTGAAPTSTGLLNTACAGDAPCAAALGARATALDAAVADIDLAGQLTDLGTLLEPYVVADDRDGLDAAGLQAAVAAIIAALP